MQISIMKYTIFCSRRRLLTIVAGCFILGFVANLRNLQEPQYSKPPPLSPLSLLPISAASPSISEPEPLPSPSELEPAPSAHKSASTPFTSEPVPSGRCFAYSDQAGVVTVLKTGATEAFNRIPPSLLTFLQCPKHDLLIFSDMEQDIGDYHIFDALDKVVGEAKLDNPDFELYNTQKEYRLAGDVVWALSDRGSDAWKLDKYKNLHIAQKAYQMRPNKSWYFFIDADTYIVWSTFFHWLKRLDPEERLYLGSAVWVGHPPYAHGGSGYLLSRAAMADLVGEDAAELASGYDLDTKDHCCGDEALAKVLFQKGLNVSNTRPMINGEKLRLIPFGPTRWCQPIITMHHITPEEINDMWHWEQQRQNPLEPLTLEELFTAIEAKIVREREDWDNGASDVKLEPQQAKEDQKFRWLFDYFQRRPWESFGHCKQACKEDPGCFMFLHYGETCVLSKSFRLGGARSPDGEVRYRSGWDLERIARWRAENSPCTGPLWEADDA